MELERRFVSDASPPPLSPPVVAVQVMQERGTSAQLWYGPPESLRHSVQWQLVMVMVVGVVTVQVYWMWWQEQLPVNEVVEVMTIGAGSK